MIAREMTREFDVSILRRRGWLARTTPDFAEAVLARSDLIVLNPGEALYQAGDPAGGLFGLLEGQVEVHALPRGDVPTLMHVCGPGFWTGEFSTVTGGARLIALQGRVQSRIMRLSRAEFLRIADNNPQAWQQLMLLVVHNLALSIAVIEALRRDNLTERLAMTLVNLAGEIAERPAVIHVSQNDLASLAHMSRASVNAALARLRDRGLVRYAYGTVTVTDLGGLSVYQDGG